MWLVYRPGYPLKKVLLQYIAARQGVLKASVYYSAVLHGREC